ncbi:MAG: hypothetical protein U0905_20340 [Pirellulales bacterium]
MMKRWTLLAAILASICFIGSSQARAQSPIDLNEAERMLDLNVVELEDQLVKGLRLFTAQQKEYVHFFRLFLFMRSSWVWKIGRFRDRWSTFVMFGHSNATPSIRFSISSLLSAPIGKRGITVP